MFRAHAQLEDSVVPIHITESLQAPRTATAHLLLEAAGDWTISVSFNTTGSGGAEDSTVTAMQRVEVEEGRASASCCKLSGFWPVQGAIADVPAGFIIQVWLHHESEFQQ